MLNRIAPLAVYVLKRQYGGPVDIYKLVSSETNVRTGVKDVITTVYHIKRAIILPAGYSRAKLSTGVIGGFPGGLRDSNARDFIVDRKDAPQLESLTVDDWIVYKQRKYQIAKVEACEFDSSWLIASKELVGEVPQQEISKKVDNIVFLEDSNE